MAFHTWRYEMQWCTVYYAFSLQYNGINIHFNVWDYPGACLIMNVPPPQCKGFIYFCPSYVSWYYYNCGLCFLFFFPPRVCVQRFKALNKMKFRWRTTATLSFKNTGWGGNIDFFSPPQNVCVAMDTAAAHDIPQWPSWVWFKTCIRLCVWSDL